MVWAARGGVLFHNDECLSAFQPSVPPDTSGRHDISHCTTSGSLHRKRHGRCADSNQRATTIVTRFLDGGQNHEDHESPNDLGAAEQASLGSLTQAKSLKIGASEGIRLWSNLF